MHKPTYQQPPKKPGQAEGQAQKPETTGNAQPFYKADRDPVISKDSFEGPAKSPQQHPKEATPQTKPQATQEENNAQKREPKQS